MQYLSQQSSLKIIFIISLLATLGSLYVGYRGDPFLNWESGYRFSRLNGIPACDLCRYMRIFQYPIVFISGIALLTKDTHSIQYIRPLALIGLIISIYKRALESGRVIETSFCTSGISCATPTQLGGFLSLPLLGVIAFLLILLGCYISYSSISSYQ